MSETKNVNLSITDALKNGYALFMGIHEKSGSFEDEQTKKTIEFHNFLITLAFPAESDNTTVNIYGADCVQYKIKAADIFAVFGLDADSDWYAFFDPSQWLYKPVDVTFKRKADRNGNLAIARISKVS